MKKYVFIMMGGIGSRMGTKKPKQFLEIEGIPVYQRVMNLYSQTESCDVLCLICNHLWIKYLRNQLKQVGLTENEKLVIVNGGATRSESVKNGILKIQEMGAKSEDVVLIHDATHMYLDFDSLLKLLKVLDTNSAATIATHVWDTVYLSDESGEVINATLNRKQIVVGASPEGFKFWLLRMLFTKKEIDINKYTSVGDLALKMGYYVKIIWSDFVNIKMTFPSDYETMKLIK